MNPCRCGAEYEPMSDEQDFSFRSVGGYRPSRMASDIPFCSSEDHPFCWKCSPTTASPTTLEKMAVQAILFEPGSKPKVWRHWTTISQWDQDYGDGMAYIGKQCFFGIPFPVDGLKNFLKSLSLPDKMKNKLERYYEIHCLLHLDDYRENSFYGKRCIKCTNYRARAQIPPHVDIDSEPTTHPPERRQTADEMDTGGRG